MDDFEQLLKSQPLRAVPPEWRGEILAAAQVAQVPKARAAAWNAWLWPSPYAWGALAAVWVVILGLNLAARPQRGPETAHAPLATQQDVYVSLVERRRELEQFLFVPKATQATLPEPKTGSPGASLDQGESTILKFA